MEVEGSPTGWGVGEGDLDADGVERDGMVVMPGGNGGRMLPLI